MSEADPPAPDEGAVIAALIELHLGLERLGPGDAAVSGAILEALPGLPERPRIADLGCGAGAGALLLASHFRAPVRAVDLSSDFLGQLRVRAGVLGLSELIETVEADMGALDWPAGCLDLLWSEGAAYSLGFSRALKAWRPLLASKGIAVISELSWFTASRPAALEDYWRAQYPAVATEEENLLRAASAGFRALGTRRLPPSAWLDNYYGPLEGRLGYFDDTADPVMLWVIDETRREIEMYRRYGDHYGYTFYLLQAV